MTTAEIVKNSKFSKFILFRDNYFVYQTDNGFQFVIPLSEVGTASFLSQDKTIFFMRWIRKQVEENNYSIQGGMV